MATMPAQDRPTVRFAGFWQRLRLSFSGLCLVQGLYYLVTGIWPLLSIQTFEAVTGYKHDHWLVKTVGCLVLIQGAVLLIAAWRRTTAVEVAVLAVGSALVLTLVDVIYVAAGVISWVYLLDAVIEVALIVGWVRVLVVDRQAGVPPTPPHGAV